MYAWFRFSLREYPIAKLPGPPLSCFLCLSAHMDSDGCASLSYRNLSRLTGFSRRTCISAIKNLENSDLLKRTNDARNREALAVRILKASSVGFSDEYDQEQEATHV